MALNAYLKLDQIDGEVSQSGFVGQIEVLAFDWTTERPDNGTALGPPVHGDLVVQATAGKQSPPLADRLNRGQGIKTGELSLHRVDQKTGMLVKYLSYTMTDCLVSSYRLSDAGGGIGTLSVEAFTLRWSTVVFTNWNGSSVVSETIIERNQKG